MNKTASLPDDLASSFGKHRVHRILYDGRPAWVKRSEPAKPRYLYYLLGIVQRSLRLETLVPVPKPGGVDALKLERARIAELRERQVPVPDVLLVGEDWHVLADIGDSLKTRLNAATPSERLDLTAQALRAIHGVHRHDACLSQAFCRNMTIDASGAFGFIDFEDNPEKYMPLVVCQARDLICFLYSVTRYLEREIDAFHTIAREAVDKWPAEVRNILENDLARLNRLLPRRGPIGRIRDIRQLRLLSRMIET